MYKFLSMFLGVCLLLLGIFFVINKYQNSKQVQNLNNQIAQNQKTIQETKDSYSKLAIDASGLKSENSDLQSKIKSRDEKVASLTQINFQLKNQSLKISDAKQTNVQQGTTQRTRVDFQKSTNVVDVSGFTLTNPPEAQVDLNFKDLNLQLALAKDDNGNFRVYLDDKNSDFTNVNLGLKVDPSVFSKKWYELVGIGGGAMIGNNVFISNIGIQVKIYHLLVGPMVGMVTGVPGNNKLYGLQFSWFPFEK